jgi:hypothetical protein
MRRAPIMINMTRAWLALCGAALTLAAQDPPAAPNAAGAELKQLRAHMADTLSLQPNYTCLETIERSIRVGKEKDFRLVDTIRLEVALVDGREMFAWPGSKQFEDTDMRTFVPTGMFGNGDFGLYAKAIFGERSPAEFEYKGEVKVGERPATRFDFRVPAVAGMRIRQPGITATVSFHGSFFAEPGTQDVLRLEVQADALPPKLDLRQVSDTMEYKRTRIGGGDFLLPSMSEIVMVDSRGDANRNVVRFSACHEFAGVSTLKFGDDDDAANPDAAVKQVLVKQELMLPKNAEVALQLVGEIDTDKAAVGDPVKAMIENDVKEKGRVILPKGVQVSGRIVRLEHYQDFTVLGLMFQEAESEKVHASLSLTMDRATGSDVLTSARWGTSTPPRPHEGLVPLRPGHLRVSRGVVMFWRN